MFSPDSDEGCRGCSLLGAHFPDHRLLRSKDTAFCAVSRAPVDRIVPFKEKTGWTFPWVSSHGSDFNYDFHVTMDEAVAPVQYNYKMKDEMVARGFKHALSGEQPGLSVFYKDGDDVYHTYSTYSRGLDRMLTTFTMLDMTPFGRQVGPMGPAEFKRPYELNDED